MPEATEGTLIGSEAPDTGKSLEELPDEYKPYPLPWDQIPEEVRPKVLDAVKEFQSSASKERTQLEELRRDAEQWRQKAEYLDLLWEQPWFQEAYRRLNAGTPQSSDPFEKLPEVLDNDTAKAIQTAVQNAIDSRLRRFEEEIGFLRHQLVARDSQAQLERLESLAKERGWPSPREKLAKMHELIQAGRATDIETAYRLAIFDELPDLAAKRAKQRYEEEIQKKANMTLPPSVGPAKPPGMPQFLGPNAEEEALKATLAEFYGGK